MNKFIYGLIGLLLVTSTAQAKGKIQNEDVKSSAEIIAAGGTNAQLINDSKIYVTANNINQQLSTAISSGLIGGGGSSLGIQLLQNSGFEVGITTGWSNTGGTFAAVSSGSNLLVGQGSATFQASGSGQFMQSSLYAIPNGLKARSCTAQILFKGGDPNTTLQVTDGTNVLSSTPLFTSVQASSLAVPSFICPSSGSLRLRIISTASSALVALDQMFLGENVVSQVSQASFIGAATIQGGNYNNSSLTYTDLPTTGQTIVLYGQAVTEPNQYPGVKFNSLAPGHYMIQATGNFAQSGVSGSSYFRCSDGTSPSIESGRMLVGSGLQVGTTTLICSFDYTVAQGATTFRIQSKVDTGSASAAVNVDSNALTVSVYRFPTQSETLVSADTINWRVDANQNGATIDLGLVAVPSLQGMGDTALVLTNVGAALPAKQPCSGTNAPTVAGSTCGAGSGGDGQAGVSWQLPAAQTVEACVSFVWNMGSGSGTLQPTFDIVETPENAQTLLQQGATFYSPFSSVDGSQVRGIPIRQCSVFQFSSAGTKTLRLFYSQAVSGTPTRSDIYGASGFSDVHWEVRPITQNVPAPVFLSTITSTDTANAYKMGVAQIQTVCTSDPCTINNQSAGFLTNVGRAGPGVYTLSFFSGIMQNYRVCMCNSIVGGSNALRSCYSDGNNVITTDNTNTVSDAQFNVQCMGY